MSFTKEVLSKHRVQVQFQTYGGPTYFVDGRPYCLNPLYPDGKEDQYCRNRAGLGTDHEDTGRCKWHGGFVGAPLKHGRYANVAKKRLQADYQEFYNDPDLLDLTPELILQRQILAEIGRRYEDSGDINDLLALLQVSKDVCTTIDKIQRIQSQQVLTAASAKLMMVKAVETMKNLLRQWYQDDEEEIENRFNQFLLTWRSEVEGEYGL